MPNLQDDSADAAATSAAAAAAAGGVTVGGQIDHAALLARDADFAHPLLQARLALLLRTLAPHAMATSDIRHLFQLLQPVLLLSGMIM